jgi:hypothetical protein
VPITITKAPGSAVFNRFTMGDQMSSVPRLSTLADVRMLNQDGPFAVVKEGELGLVLDSPDKSLFSGRMSQHEGRPSGRRRGRRARTESLRGSKSRLCTSGITTWRRT